MIEKLEAITEKLKKTDEALLDPAVVSDTAKYRELMKEHICTSSDGCKKTRSGRLWALQS